jgi:hypothetical protein
MALCCSYAFLSTLLSIGGILFTQAFSITSFALALRMMLQCTWFGYISWSIQLITALYLRKVILGHEISTHVKFKSKSFQSRRATNLVPETLP